MTTTNIHGNQFTAGDRVKWDDTQATHEGTIKRIDEDGIALVLDGAYGADYVHIDSLYR